MKNITSSQIANTRRIKKMTCNAVCLIVVLLTGWKGYQEFTNPEHPRGAAHSRTFITNRALEIGLALSGSARLLAPPTLIEEQHCLPQIPYRRRKLWLVLCESGNKQLNMLFDDKTGRLSCMLMESPGNTGRIGQANTHIVTAGAAAAASLDGLKALQVLPHGCRVALRERPEIQTRQDTWGVNWLVRLSPTASPFTLKTTMDRNTGQPIYMAEVHAKS